VSVVAVVLFFLAATIWRRCPDGEDDASGRISLSVKSDVAESPLRIEGELSLIAHRPQAWLASETGGLLFPVVGAKSRRAI
jgi:hypothetical protein